MLEAQVYADTRAAWAERAMNDRRDWRDKRVRRVRACFLSTIRTSFFARDLR